MMIWKGAINTRNRKKGNTREGALLAPFPRPPPMAGSAGNISSGHLNTSLGQATLLLWRRNPSARSSSPPLFSSFSLSSSFLILFFPSFLFYLLILFLFCVSEMFIFSLFFFHFFSLSSFSLLFFYAFSFFSFICLFAHNLLISQDFQLLLSSSAAPFSLHIRCLAHSFLLSIF